MLRPVLFPLLLALVAGCGGKPAADYANEAQAALDGGDPAKALTLADEALAQDAVKKDAPVAWRVEQIKLEALAKTGKGAEVAAGLEKAAAAYPKAVTAALYRSLADKVKGAGDNAGAIEVLTAGDKRFPADHDSFVKDIETLNSSGNLDPAEVEKLKSLGYL